jgi:dihydrofolate reductase
MTKLTLDISMSLDGFIAGPNRTVDQPLGDGGEQLHDWIFGLATWMEAHGVEGEGATGPEDDLVKEQIAQQGAVIMGRRMFSGGEGAWRTTRGRRAGGETPRRSTSRSSSSPTTHARR